MRLPGRTPRLFAALCCAAIVTTACGSGSATPATTTSSAPTSTVAPSTSAPTGTTIASTPDAAHPCGTAATPPARYQHVVWIWMENHTWSSIIGNRDAPYLTHLAALCGTDRHWSAVGSPSLPNYLGATSGSTQGIHIDTDPGAHSFAADNLFRQVRAAGGTEASYLESMPSPCDLVPSGLYTTHHNPAAFYVGPGDRAACRKDDLPFTEFAGVLRSGTLPTFTSITPNVCHDMHSCPVKDGDTWLATWVPRILDSPAYASGTTAVVIVFDEPTLLANVVVAPSIRPGTVSSMAVDHYSLLKATEQMLGLPFLGRAASATSLRRALPL